MKESSKCIKYKKKKSLTLCCAPSSGPLATLAGVYQDVKGQRPEALWRETVSLWTGGLVEVIPSLLGNPQLRPLAQAGVATLSIALDAVRKPFVVLCCNT